MSNSVWPHRRQPTRLTRSWDSPGQNTGVGCHFLLQWRRQTLLKKILCSSVVLFILKYLAAAAAKSLESCPTLCDPIDGSPPGSPAPGVLQARTLERVAISFSNAGKWKVKVKSLSHVRLSDPVDCSPPGSSVHGIFQARVLEWGAISYSGLDR